MRRSPDGLTILLALAALLLAAVAWLAVTRPIAVAPIADAGTTVTANDALGAERVKPGPLAAYPETTKRPLMEPARRPVLPKAPETARPREAPAPVQQKSVTPPPPIEGLKLLGVVKSGREPFRALVRTREGEAGQWVVEGGELGAWRVVSIADSRVVLEAQGQRVELAMFAEPKPIVKR